MRSDSWSHLLFQQPKEASAGIIPILQMGRLRLKEAKKIIEVHGLVKQQSQNVNQDLSD